MATVGLSGLSSISKLLGGLLAAHTARLRGAESENAAMPQAISAFDADMREIVSEYNSGQVDARGAIDATNRVDAQIKQYLQSQANKPGTGWTDHTSQPCNDSTCSAICNKTCTAGCCNYFAQLSPSLNSAREAFTAGTGTINIKKIYSSKYSTFSREAYTLQVSAPSSLGTAGSILGLGSGITGIANSIEQSIGLSAPVATSNPNNASINGGLSPAVNFSYFGVFIVAVIVLAMLFTGFGLKGR